MSPSGPTHDRVRELLGREPQGDYEIVVTDGAGDPVVLRNAPFLNDGTPMPTRYWLIGPAEIRRVGQLESTGGVDRAEAEVDDAELAAAHDRYAAERDAAIPADHTGPRPSGGVGGTRVGVKCLHAHWAWHLAGGDDPIGRWIETELTPAVDDSSECIVTVDADHTTLQRGASEHTIPWGATNLTARWLSDHDPPRPDALTNALGAIADHLDDAIRLDPDLVNVERWVFHGATITSLACVEVGATVSDEAVAFERAAAEEVFRTVATEAASDRAHNPGLPSGDVDVIVATSCIVQACMRSLHLDSVTLMAGPARAT